MYYGWKIVGVSFLTHFISVGFIFYSYGVFFKEMLKEFGGSRLEVAIGLAIMNWAIGLTSPFLGRLLERVPIRNVMCTGAVALALGFFLASRVTAMWQFYVLLGSLMGIGSAFMGQLPSASLVANWFVGRRGMALGIATMGISFSGVVMAPVATELIFRYGWRTMFVIFGLIVLSTVLPAIWFFVIGRPEDIGLRPDGGAIAESEPGRKGSNEASPRVGSRSETIEAPIHRASTLELLKDRNFWAIAAFLAFNFCANGAILTHIIPHATDLGYSAKSAAYVLSAIASMGVVGKVIFGWITDRIDKRAASWIAISLQAIGTVLILRTEEYRGLLMAGGVFGLGMGGIVPLWGSMLGATYGRHVFGRVMGLMHPFMLPIHTLGVPFAGWVYDTRGNYDLAFKTFVFLYFIAGGALLAVRIPEVEPGTEGLGGEAA